MKINLTGDIGSIIEGVRILEKDLGIEIARDGYPVSIIKRKGPLSISNQNGEGIISFEKEIHFFRGLGLWYEHYQKEKEFSFVEEPKFDMTGAMLDVSRNAVMNVTAIEDFLRNMSVMGLNTVMLYTEDTFEVKDYPYFGYMRGRYTEDELSHCDQYAQKLGIEMIPCIQTLAHLTEALKWNYATDMKDTSDILLVGQPKTYEFLQKIIQAASKPFKSKRIHIGMDEAHMLGLGRYLEENGYEDRFAIMNKHLEEVVAITQEFGLKPMIWSDMYFRLGSKYGEYYDLEASIPEEVIKSIPDVQLVYWDYYHDEETFYQTFIQKHKELGSTPIFAGGVWTWNGIAPNYGKAFVTTEAGLNACKKEGVQEVFATMWGDNGAETPLTTSLPVLQLFAEHSYHNVVDYNRLAERFHFCTGGKFDDFNLLNQFDETPGVSKNNLLESHPSKLLLWQDLLIGLYDANIAGLNLNQHYKKLERELSLAKEQNPKWRSMFAMYEQLAKVLSIKSEMGIQIKEAYDKDDKEEMEEILNQLNRLQSEVDVLRKSHRLLWFELNKPFGWEVLDIRYGGVLARLETAHFRLSQWVSGKMTRIDELEAERLYYEGPWPMPKEGTLGRNQYHKIVTASAFSN